MTNRSEPTAEPPERRRHGDLPLVDAASAAASVSDDATVLTSGFGSVGYPKAIPLALAEDDRNLELTVVHSGNVGEEIDVALVEAGAIARRFGYVVERDNGYHVGLRFLDIGVTARNSHRGYKLVRDKVEEIADVTGERAQFFVEEHGEAVYLARSVGNRAVRTDPGIGSRIPLYAASAGKAILAELPEPELFEMVEQMDFEPLTEYTITDSDELLRELDEIRERGYSFNREESLRGTHAAGVAICGPSGEVIGALSVTGPSHRMKGERFEQELPDLLLGAANELELNIAHS